MGSSVFHGGFSTFLAIVTLAPSKTYIFVVFFRLWFGIIIFGMANGFMLLPVILSFIGQTDAVVDHSVIEGDHEEEVDPDENNKRYESESNPLFKKNETAENQQEPMQDKKQPTVEMTEMGKDEKKPE